MYGNDKSGLEDKYVFIYLGNILPFGYCSKSIFWLLIKNNLYVYLLNLLTGKT